MASSVDSSSQNGEEGQLFILTDDNCDVSRTVEMVDQMPGCSNQEMTAPPNSQEKEAVTAHIANKKKKLSDNSPVIVIGPHQYLQVSGDHAMAIAENENNLNVLQAHRSNQSPVSTPSVIVVHSDNQTIPAANTARPELKDDMQIQIVSSEAVVGLQNLTNGGITVSAKTPKDSNDQNQLCNGALGENTNINQYTVLNGQSVATMNTELVGAEESSTIDHQSASILFQVVNEDGKIQNVNLTTGKPLEKNTQKHHQVAKKDISTADPEKPYGCDLCSATFTRYGNYTRHRMVHTVAKEDSYRYKCKSCERQFLQKCDLKRHEHIHTGTEPHRCTICDKGYLRKSDLVVHMRFHNKERAFQCDQCDKAYFQSGDLYRHIRRQHDKVSQLTCGHCMKKYTKEATLLRHIQAEHKDIIFNSLTANKESQQHGGMTDGSQKETGTDLVTTENTINIERKDTEISCEQARNTST